MKMNLKRRLSVFLCLLMAVPTIMGAIPQAKLEAQAASNTVVVNNKWISTGSEVQITTKTKGFYAGDLFRAYSYGSSYKNYGALSMNSGVTYKSSKPAVASVDKSSGLIKAKKKGSTTITVKFKGKSVAVNIKVVSSLGTVPSYKKLEKAADNMIKAYGKKITSKSRYQVVNAYNQYKEEIVDTGRTSLSTVSVNSGIGGGYDTEKRNYIYKMHFPILLHADSVSGVVNDYKSQRNPVGTGQAKLFKVTSVSAKNNVVTAKLEKKVTEDQIFGLKAASSTLWDTKIAKGKTAEFPLYIKDTKTGHRYYAVATATEGKNTLSIKLKNKKLTKGNSYRLQGMEYYKDGNVYTHDWTNQGKPTFKVK